LRGKKAWWPELNNLLQQGNEFSFYMLLASSFMINEGGQAEEWSIYPWMHTNCNQLSNADQLRAVSIERNTYKARFIVGESKYSMMSGFSCG
jgi:hypothetical protein